MWGLSDKDIQGSALYQEVEGVYRALRQPGTGQISDIADLNVATDGHWVTFTGISLDRLEGTAPSRICLTHLRTGDTRVVTFGPHTDRSPKFSPDGHLIAFLSDRGSAGNYQLYLLDVSTGASRSLPSVTGWVEYLHWSPDGTCILLAVAAHGADIAGGQGAITSATGSSGSASWMPAIECAGGDHRRRSAWIYELATDTVRQISHPQVNVWEAVWCGNGALAAVASEGAEESDWYDARLKIIKLPTGDHHDLLISKDQLGCPAASPSGHHVAVLEAFCSDRWIIAGNLRIIDTRSGNAMHIDTAGMDVSCVEWRSDHIVLLAGHRGFDTVVGKYDLRGGRFSESWHSHGMSTAGFYASVAGLGAEGDCVLAGENFARAPEIAVIRSGVYTPVKSFALDGGEQAQVISNVEQITWTSFDGLEIQGWLLSPTSKPPFPLVMNVHGGPVGHSRPIWVGRRGGAPHLMLVKRGFAVFFPNPRGSGGRGQSFAREVYGDIGGGDAKDLLCGLDELVRRGIADPNRLGVTGISYGGFMTAWLVTQDTRFAAAVAVAPHTNQVTERLLSNIPRVMDFMTADEYDNPGGRYFDRSPIMHARKVRTPTLSICGLLDRCTPPEEAAQFYNALRAFDVPAALVTYPEEGHGIRKLPAAIDYTARMISWFETYMPPT